MTNVKKTTYTKGKKTVEEVDHETEMKAAETKPAKKKKEKTESDR